MTALVLAGHGSQVTPETAGVVWRHVDALRAYGAADEVAACFWKEPPGFAGVLNSLASRDVFIVPVFTAAGFFTREVVPAEFGLASAVTERDGRRIVYTPTLAERGGLAERVLERAMEGLARADRPADECAIVLIGHGARRNSDSRSATFAQADRLREYNIAAETVAVFLDDSPDIPSAFTSTSVANLIVVPYFLASGSHVTLDVPRALGLEPGRNTTTLNGRNIIYTAPVGEDAALWRDLLQLARDFGLPIRQSSGTSWNCFPQTGRTELAEAVRNAGVMKLGQLRLTKHSVEKWGDPSSATVVDDPAKLRGLVRDDPFRPLSTSTDLTGGWQVETASDERLLAIVETIYPGVVGDWTAQQAGCLRIQALDEVAGRQVGAFRSLSKLSASSIADQVARTCGGCVRAPLWFSPAVSTDGIPCAEPCNFWMTRALKECIADGETR